MRYVTCDVHVTVTVPVNADTNEEAMADTTHFILNGEFHNIFQEEIEDAVQYMISDENNVEILCVEEEED